MFDETRHKTVQISKNTWIRTVGLYKKSSKLLQARVHALELEGKKREFGVQFMNKVIETPEDDLGNIHENAEIQKLIQSRRQEIVDGQERIKAWKAEASDIGEKTRKKIQRRQRLHRTQKQMSQRRKEDATKNGQVPPSEAEDESIHFFMEREKSPQET